MAVRRSSKSAWMVEVIEENMRREDDTSEPDPSLGYAMPVSIEKKPGGTFTYVSVYDGDSWPCKSFAANRAEFSITDDDFTSNPLVTFPIFKAAMLILAETWEATWAKAFPNDMVRKKPIGTGENPAGGGWSMSARISPSSSRRRRASLWSAGPMAGCSWRRRTRFSTRTIPGTSPRRG